MHLIDFGPEHGARITEYESRGATAQPLADGMGEAHVYAVHLEAGGEIGPHPAGFEQLFLVVAGSAWVSGGDGVRRPVRAGQGAVIARGEIHAKGSDSGCSAVMIQLAAASDASPPTRARAMGTVLWRLAAHDWPDYRDLRLRALADAPDAFGSTFAREAARSDDEWRARLAAGASSPSDLPLVAIVDDAFVGLAWGRLDEQQPDIAYLFQVWVAPEVRGMGVGRLLVDAVIAWARTGGARVLRLAVACGDSAASRLYRRAGFVDDGDPQPIRPGSDVKSQPMVLDLQSGSRWAAPNVSER